MSYVYLNVNPDKKKTTDCVIRAVSFALGQEWDTTFTEIAVECLMHHDMPEANYIWAGYLKSKGYKRKLIPDSCPNCYTVKEFCLDYPYGIYILGTGSHTVAVRDGNYYDIWDSGDEIPIYYWTKGE